MGRRYNGYQNIEVEYLTKRARPNEKYEHRYEVSQFRDCNAAQNVVDVI